MKTAIFGGAFDPFHKEHKSVIVNAQKSLSLDRVVVVPSFLPPHKDHLCSPYEVRREMVKAGVSDLPYVIIDDIEKERGEVNPTSVTLPILKEKYPSDEFFFIMGGDSVKNFHSWINPQKIADEAILAVVERSGCGDFDIDVKSLVATYGAKVIKIPYVGKRVSSSVVKATVELGFESNDISDEVRKIIDEHGLYRKFGTIIKKLKADIPEKTFIHCSSTAIYGENFAGENKLTYEEVFLACILHDCAKHIKVEMEGVPAPVVHQFTGAERARDFYGVTDERILSAIRYHTSGKPDMTKLEKITFSADMLEPNRNFDGVEKLRAIMDEDFEKGFVACVNATYTHLLAKGGEIYPLTRECAEYYNK